MRKIIQYIMMALIAVILASCANDINEKSVPTAKNDIQFVVDEFPIFEKLSTRTVGKEDKGKTAWAVGDEICVKLRSQELGTQTAILKYNGVKFEIQDGKSLCYLDGEPVTAYAYYAPNRRWINGSLELKDGERDGTAEFLEATCTVHYGDNNYVDISFANATRNYSRLRIATIPKTEIKVAVKGFTPVFTGFSLDITYTLTSDEKGNAYLYGTFENNSEVTVKYREAPLKTYTFSQATENAKSYALDATVVSLADEGITYDQIVGNVKKELDAGKTYINLMLAPDADEETLDAIHIGLLEGDARDGSINLTLIGCKKIPYEGFKHFDMLKSIALPDVTEIEGKAFSDCTKLQKVVLGNLTKVYGNVGKNGIFEGCRTEDIDLVLSKDQKVMNGGKTEGGYCWTADIIKDYAGSDEHNSKEFLGYENFKSITCDYPVP